MPEATRLVTAGELEKFPRDDRRYELVDGRIIPMSPVAYQHGRVVTRLLIMLISTCDRETSASHDGGGFTLRTDPDTVRAPDVAFLRRERIPVKVPARVLEGIRTLPPKCVPGDRRDSKKVAILRFGVPLVWSSTRMRERSLYRPSAPPAVLVRGRSRSRGCHRRLPVQGQDLPVVANTRACPRVTRRRQGLGTHRHQSGVLGLFDRHAVFEASRRPEMAGLDPPVAGCPPGSADR
jgi:hypothetical protein